MHRLDNLLAPLIGAAFVAVVALALGSAWQLPVTTLPAAALAAVEEVRITPSRIEVVGECTDGDVQRASFDAGSGARSAI